MPWIISAFPLCSSCPPLVGNSLPCHAAESGEHPKSCSPEQPILKAKYRCLNEMKCPKEP